MMEGWKTYSEEKPEEGVFLWRMPSEAIPEITIRIFALMRSRGANYSSVLSPSFDSWDGYNVRVPDSLEWRFVKDAPKIKHGFAGLYVEGADVLQCPFCKKVPRWRAIIKSGKYAICSQEPHKYNRWWLECCSWAKSPHLDNPIQLSAERNALLDRKI